MALRATGDDIASGGANMTAAEYFIDTAGSNGTGTSLALNAADPAPLAGFNGTIAAATVAALPEGTHTIYIHSQDAAGNWGAFATIILNVDKTGPAAGNLSVAPNPNNGTLSFDPNRTVVKVSATVGDPVAGGVQSSIKAAEGFLDAAGPNGSGFQTFVASDGVFNSSTEGVYALIPLSGIQALSQGPHTFYVHGRDAAGNWGPLSTVVLTVDKTGPAVTNVTGTPNPTNGATSVTLNATATDPANAGPTGSAAASSIVAAEWFRGADPGAGNFNSPSEGVRATIDVGGLSFGNHTIFVRAKDAAGNWGSATSATLNVLPADALFANSFESGNVSAWTAATGATIGVNTAAMMGRDGGTRGMQATINGTTPTGYVTDGTPNNEASYHARFYFNPHSTGTNTGARDVFAGQNTAGTTILRVQYRRTALGAFQIRAGALQQSATTPTAFTAWITVSNAAHAIEVAWQAGANGRLTLYIDGTSRATLSNLATSAIEIMLRWLNFIAIAGLLGPLALSLTAISTVRAPAVVPVQRRLLRVIVWSGVLALLVGGALLVATTTTVGAWWQILNGTGYGMRWLLRQGALLAIVAITVWALRGRSFEAMSPWPHPERVPDKSRLLLVAITPLALSIVVLHALNSHAAGLRTGAFVATLADVAHLLAACFWVGGLVALAVAIAPLMGRGGDEAALARTVLRRFGILAATSLAMLLATGLYATGQQVASLDALLLTLYGHALLLKICLGLCIGLIGLLHAATFHPRVADAVGHLLRRPAGWMPLGDRHVRRTVILEAAGGTSILLLTALMGATQPARGPRFDPPPAPITAPASITTPLADLLVTLSVKPDRTGHNIVLLGIFNTRRPAPAPIERVVVRFQALSSRHATTVIASSLGGGRYQATGASLNVAGAWRISVTVDRAGLRPATVTVPWTVLPLASPAAPPPVVFSKPPPGHCRPPWRRIMPASTSRQTM